MEILSSLNILIPSCFTNHKVLTKHLFSRQALLGVRLQHLAHKALSTVRNLRPRFSLEVNHSPQNRQSHPSFVLYTKPKHFNKIQTQTQTQHQINKQHLSIRKEKTHTCPKRRNPTQQNIKNNPSTPHIHFWPIIPLQYLWCHVVRTPHNLRKSLPCPFIQNKTSAHFTQPN